MLSQRSRCSTSRCSTTRRRSPTAACSSGHATCNSSWAFQTLCRRGESCSNSSSTNSRTSFPTPPGPPPASAATSSKSMNGGWSSAGTSAPASRTTLSSTRRALPAAMRNWSRALPTCARPRDGARRVRPRLDRSCNCRRHASRRRNKGGGPMQATSQGSAGMSIGKIALASAIGTTIEWYDFFLYGVVTPIVLNKLFFPNFDPIVGTLLAYATFFVGFLSPPIGGIIFGHYGDRIGRKTVLVLTLLIMGIATFLIGLLPTYASVGIWAPAMLLFLRIFQGIGIGGEWGGAVLMAVEHSPAGKRGFYGSWPQVGVPAGLLLSSGMVYLLSFLPEDDFFSWGWRISFLISAVLVAIGLYIRLKIMETPAFTGLQQAQKIAHVPFFELIRTHGWNTLLGLGARYIEGVTFNIYGVFIIAYVTGALQLPRQTALAGVMISSALMIFMLPIYGNLSDRIGRRRMFAVAGLLIGILSFPAFWLMETKSPILIWLAITVPFAFVYRAVYGPQAALFSELFDTRVRYTGISFVYQFSGIFASGLTAIIATSLRPAGGKKPWLICAYILIVSMISAASVFAMRDMHKRDMTADNVVPGLKPAKQA